MWKCLGRTLVNMAEHLHESNWRYSYQGRSNQGETLDFPPWYPISNGLRAPCSAHGGGATIPSRPVRGVHCIAVPLIFHPLPPYHARGPLFPRHRCCCPSSWACIRSRKPVSEIGHLTRRHDLVQLFSRLCTCVLRAWRWARFPALGDRKGQCKMRECNALSSARLGKIRKGIGDF